MDELEIKIKLDMLADCQAQKDALNLVKQELIDSILTPEIKAKIVEVEAEFSGKSQAADENAERLQAEVKKAILEAGSSVKSKYLNAIYMKGRITWDAKTLDGYAVGHPEILFMRKEGDPSVSIRKV